MLQHLQFFFSKPAEKDPIIRAACCSYAWARKSLTLDPTPLLKNLACCFSFILKKCFFQNCQCPEHSIFRIASGKQVQLHVGEYNI